MIDYTANRYSNEYDLLEYTADHVRAGRWKDGHLMRADVHDMWSRPCARTVRVEVATDDESDDRVVWLELMGSFWQDARWCETYRVHVAGGPAADAVMEKVVDGVAKDLEAMP